MTTKTMLPLLILGALLLAGCASRPQESGDNTSVKTCPSDLNNASNDTSGNSTYGAATDGSDSGDECAPMEAPTPGSSGNETTTNETNTTSSYP